MGLILAYSLVCMLLTKTADQEGEIIENITVNIFFIKKINVDVKTTMSLSGSERQYKL